MAAPVTGKLTTSAQTISVAIGATNGERYLLAFGRQERNPLDSSSMSFNGVAGTQIGTARDSTNCRIIAFWWDDGDLPAGAGSYNLTVNGSSGSAALSIEYFYWDAAEQGAPFFSDGGTALASPIQDVFSGLSSGALRVIAAVESSSTSTNTALSNCTLNANEAIVGSLTFFQGSAYSTTTDTVGFTSDDTYEGWISVGINPAASGGAASITSVTGPGSIDNTIRAGESFTVACTGAEATRGAGTLTVGGVEVDSYVSWSDTSVVAIAPTDGLMFGGSKDVVLTPDSNTADTQSGITYLPPTGYSYVTYSGGAVTANSVFWDGDSAVTGLAANDQAYYSDEATVVGGSTPCTFVVTDGTGVVTLEDVTEPGDYENDTVKLRDASDGLDSAAYTVTIDSTAPTGTVSWDQPQITDSNHTSVSFTFSGVEVGIDYSYEIESTGGGTPVSGSGTFSTSTDQVSNVDVSGLEDGTVTLTVTMVDSVGNETIVSDSIGKVEDGFIYPIPGTGTVSDNWYQYLIGLGWVGTFNDMVMNWLGSLGYTGAYNDRTKKFKDDNNLPPNIGI